MNTANLENCKQLYELSGWETEKYYWEDNRNRPVILEYKHLKLLEYKPLWLHNPKENVDNHVVPAYDLGYLLRKLPRFIEDGDMLHRLKMSAGTDHGWLFCYTHNNQPWLLGDADTPEDAACLLDIKLFEEGILTSEEGVEVNE